VVEDEWVERRRDGRGGWGGRKGAVVDLSSQTIAALEARVGYQRK